MKTLTNYAACGIIGAVGMNLFFLLCMLFEDPSLISVRGRSMFVLATVVGLPMGLWIGYKLKWQKPGPVGGSVPIEYSVGCALVGLLITLMLFIARWYFS